ncbi:DUF459 domain-containing protein [Nitratireductor sp. CAU 1489]|uniref:DUF459 domain-containing protein n=1 Tax=Nitratireductor arenosus TaxID=2682096 RepID=A0A844QAU9_9HYPH|nr:DUF459 domain-containing protein [Nitratireductor arenosus]MVA95774.1 DUF459 domain-containing protein [Nitratireductor arenosus]
MHERASTRLPTTRLLAIALLALATVFIDVAGGAFAQERPRTLLEFLFRGGRERARQPERRQVPQVKKRTTTRRATAPSRSSAPSRPTVDAVEKAEDARVVVIVGDFLAGGLAEGLTTVFAEDPTVRIVDRSNGSSGFVRDDFYNWPAEIGPILDEVKPAVGVVMMGSNDRQQMRVDGNRESVRSEKWTAEYATRAGTLAQSFAERGVPVVWVGLPAFKFSTMTSDMLAFNDLQRNAVETVGGTFVDIWEGFVDENGAYAATGPDINGQAVRLRAGDGINFTQAGRRKIAFYAEKPLKRILGAGPSSIFPDLGVPELLGPPTAGQPTVERTPPIALGDPDLDGGDELLGASLDPKTGEAVTLSEKLAIEGKTPAPRPGRVDDFSIGVEPAVAVVPQPGADRDETSAIVPAR